MPFIRAGSIKDLIPNDPLHTHHTQNPYKYLQTVCAPLLLFLTQYNNRQPSKIDNNFDNINKPINESSRQQSITSLPSFKSFSKSNDITKSITMSSSPNRLQSMLTSKLKYSRKPSLDAASINKPIVAISSPPSSSPAEIRTIQAVNEELRAIAAQTTAFNYRNIVKAVRSFQFQSVRPEGSHLKQIEAILMKHGYSMGDPSEIDGVLTIPCKPSSAEARRRSSTGITSSRSILATITPSSAPSDNIVSEPIQQFTATSQLQSMSTIPTQQRPSVIAQFELPNIDIIVQNVSGKPIACNQSSLVQQEILEHFRTLNFMKFKAVITELTKNENSIVKNRSAKTPIEDIFLKNKLIFRSCTKSDNTLHLIAIPSATPTRPLMCKPFVPAPVEATPTSKLPKKLFLRRASQAVEPLSALKPLNNAPITQPITTITSPVSFESVMDGSQEDGEENTSTLHHNERFDLSNTTKVLITIPVATTVTENNGTSALVATADEVEISSIDAPAEIIETSSIVAAENLQPSPIIAAAEEVKVSSIVTIEIVDHACITDLTIPITPSVETSAISPSITDVSSTAPTLIDVSPATLSLIKEATTLEQCDVAIPATISLIKDTTVRKLNFDGERPSSSFETGSIKITPSTISAPSSSIHGDVSTPITASPATPSSNNLHLLSSYDSGYSSEEDSFSSNSTNVFDNIACASDLAHAMKAVEKAVESFSAEIASALESAITRIEKRKAQNNTLSKKVAHGSAANISFGFNKKVSVGNAMLLIHSNIELAEGSSTIEASVPVESSRIPTVSRNNNSLNTTVVPPPTSSRQPNHHAQTPNTSSAPAVTASSSTTSLRTAIPQRASSRGSSTSHVTTAAVRPSANIRCNARALRAAVKSDKPKFSRNVWN